MRFLGGDGELGSRLRALVLVIALVAACGQPMPPSPAPIVAPAVPNAPAEVEQRVPLPFCGAEIVTQGQVGFDVAARVCFWAAYESGRPAEFTSQQPTAEGDPIVQIFRLLPDGTVEIFVDSTKDRWSTRDWLRLECAALVRLSGEAASPAFAGDQCREQILGRRP